MSLLLFSLLIWILALKKISIEILVGSPKGAKVYTWVQYAFFFCQTSIMILKNIWGKKWESQNPNIVTYNFLHFFGFVPVHMYFYLIFKVAAVTV